MKKTNIEKICEYLETSADFINNLPRYIKSQAKNIPENEIEDFAIGSEEKKFEIASLYDAIDLYIMISQYRNKKN
jgi:predicted RNA-binding protein associated with RNAse of E/G family